MTQFEIKLHLHYTVEWKSENMAMNKIWIQDICNCYKYASFTRLKFLLLINNSSSFIFNFLLYLLQISGVGISRMTTAVSKATATTIIVAWSLNNQIFCVAEASQIYKFITSLLHLTQTFFNHIVNPLKEITYYRRI